MRGERRRRENEKKGRPLLEPVWRDHILEGQRVQKTPGGRKKGLIIAGAAAAVLLAAYLGLCAWVGASAAILPNVSVAGIDVSGMTAEQAQAALERAAAEEGKNVVVTLRYKDWSGSLTAADLEIDWGWAAELAQAQGRASFFTQGAQYLLHLAGQGGPVSLPRGGSGSQPALNSLLDQADREVGGSVTRAAYQVDGDRLKMTKGVTGIAVDREQTWPEVMDAFDEGFAQKFGRNEAGVVTLERELSVEETPPQEPEFEGIWRELYAEPENARMDPETYQITDHVVGVDFSVEALRSAYQSAGEGETFTIPLELEQPKETRESLEAKLFKDLLGEGTTRVSGSANRKFNVKLSAQACNEKILLPGEEFSYNTTTGSRTAAKGYLPAPVYVGGKSEDEVGGGICQTSSTIYYAVLHTNLEVVERKCHMYNTGYVDEGMDATVYYGSTDFRFKNSTDYPIKLVTESYDKGGNRYLTVKIYGTNADGIYAVPKSTTFDWVTPTTQYKADESIPRGTTKVDSKQNPYTGVKASTYRYIYDKDGSLLEKQEMGSSSYKMRPKTILYNPADGDPATWPNGVPPVPGAVDPGSAGDPGASTDPGATTDPGTTADPGTAEDPGVSTDPGAVTEPTDPEPSGAAGEEQTGGQTAGEDGQPSQDVALD